MSDPYLSIIVPAYNEAERISTTLLDMEKRLQDMDFSYEIIVVNDGSKDKTVDVVRSLEKNVKNLKLLDLVKNVGKGGAVRAGMLAGKGNIRIFTDADNSTSIDQVKNMLPYFSSGEKGGYGVVLGSRMVAGAKLEPAEPWYRGIIGRILNLIIQFFLLPGIWDTQCGFKAFTAEAAERVFSVAKINGWGFDFEAIAIARTIGYRIKEIPVRWVNDTRTHVTFGAGFTFLRDIFKVRWWLSTKNY
jgi:glycosyltransferase involved in cell wall biosynthesis